MAYLFPRTRLRPVTTLLILPARALAGAIALKCEHSSLPMVLQLAEPGVTRPLS